MKQAAKGKYNNVICTCTGYEKAHFNLCTVTNLTKGDR